MSVLIETSTGEIVVDLFVEDCPVTTKNFLKLCKAKYFNNNLVFEVQRNHIIQTGDPTGTGQGGNSIQGLIASSATDSTQKRIPFADEIRPHLRFNRAGLLCMANQGSNTNTSQFFITLRGNDLEYLQDKHTIFGVVEEGLDTAVQAMNEAELDLKGRPLMDIRVLHTHVLDDPFDDPPELEKINIDVSGHRPAEETISERIPWGTDINDTGGKTESELADERKDKEAHGRAQVLTILGDLPDADVKPPENVLFVCKLNAITEDEDLEVIFSRFGQVKACDIVRDRKTGDSLQYAFVEFETEEQCQQAYLKMNNVLVDDRRIRVDFSQSVSKLWNRFTSSKGSSGKGGPKGGAVSQRAQLGMQPRVAKSYIRPKPPPPPPSSRTSSAIPSQSNTNRGTSGAPIISNSQTTRSTGADKVPNSSSDSQTARATGADKRTHSNSDSQTARATGAEKGTIERGSKTDSHHHRSDRGRGEGGRRRESPDRDRGSRHRADDRRTERGDRGRGRDGDSGRHRERSRDDYESRDRRSRRRSRSGGNSSSSRRRH